MKSIKELYEYVLRTHKEVIVHSGKHCGYLGKQK